MVFGGGLDWFGMSLIRWVFVMAWVGCVGGGVFGVVCVGDLVVF